MMNSGPVRDGAAQAASAASDAPLLKLEDFLPHRLNVLSSLVSQALTARLRPATVLEYRNGGSWSPSARTAVMTGKAGGRPDPYAQDQGLARGWRSSSNADLSAGVPIALICAKSFLSLTPAGRAVYEELAPSALEFMNKLAEVVAIRRSACLRSRHEAMTKRSAELVAEIERGKI